MEWVTGFDASTTGGGAWLVTRAMRDSRARATEKITGLRESGARGREADAGCVSRSSGPDTRLGSHQASVTWTLGDKEERTYITPSENTVDLHSCEVEM